jgi:mannose-6-phosphate isomerase-like protein (cupin superfamily)
MTAAITRKSEIPPQQGTSGELTRVMLDAEGAGGRLVRRLVDVAAEAAYTGTAGPGGELWFVIAGSGELEENGSQAGRVGPQTGVLLPGGTGYRLRPDGGEPVQLDVVSLPGLFNAGGGLLGEQRVVELADCAVETTGDRRFRVLFGPGRGCAAATQFVGEIPPGRAPEHSHPYDEVVLILAGDGVVHLGPAEEPLAAGSCVHLPPGQPHCLENTGRETLVVLGVFHPGGSPAQKQQAQTEAG